MSPSPQSGSIPGISNPNPPSMTASVSAQASTLKVRPLNLTKSPKFILQLSYIFCTMQQIVDATCGQRIGSPSNRRRMDIFRQTKQVSGWRVNYLVICFTRLRIRARFSLMSCWVGSWAVEVWDGVPILVDFFNFPTFLTFLCFSESRVSGSGLLRSELRLSRVEQEPFLSLVEVGLASISMFNIQLLCWVSKFKNQNITQPDYLCNVDCLNQMSLIYRQFKHIMIVSVLMCYVFLFF